MTPKGRLSSSNWLTCSTRARSGALKSMLALAMAASRRQFFTRVSCDYRRGSSAKIATRLMSRQARSKPRKLQMLIVHFMTDKFCEYSA
jgi:hypothetical protein